MRACVHVHVRLHERHLPAQLFNVFDLIGRLLAGVALPQSRAPIYVTTVARLVQPAAAAPCPMGVLRVPPLSYSEYPWEYSEYPWEYSPATAQPRRLVHEQELTGLVRADHPRERCNPAVATQRSLLQHSSRLQRNTVH